MGRKHRASTFNMLPLTPSPVSLRVKVRDPENLSDSRKCDTVKGNLFKQLLTHGKILMEIYIVYIAWVFYLSLRTTFLASKCSADITTPTILP